ncbi:NIPSNAP family protein [Deminuibacter soli]|uniref:NIPSNAP family containing protein n=1 Tax=Deminuibacter soli TaxID=2291815 RepID=A0A3E1NCU3_9BACT|nr:NIPSNAP family protein [Deminuibacter soli]RFM25760.1 NIPSNAP family containing protein [Deminuibacter soli]
MNRRNFVKSTITTGAVLTTTASVANAAATMHNDKKQQWYELRTYEFTSEAQQQLTGTYLQQAYLPALNRAGIQQAGVFTELEPKGIASIYVLIPFASIEAFAAINDKLQHDAAYLKAGEAYLAAEPANAAYDRIESSLLKAFAHMPQLEVPEKKDRLFELRRYESPTESAGQKKIEMFNDAGEIDIFKKIGARPVFFGETMVGLRRPNLTYMLCFDDMAAHDARWKAFIGDPEWKKVSAIPEYSDAKLISKIVRTFLKPADYSQI